MNSASRPGARARPRVSLLMRIVYFDRKSELISFPDENADLYPGCLPHLVSIAHGQPFGSLWKYAAGNDKVLGRVTLGMFPATLDLSPDGDFAYVVNFNLHGDMIPSTVSVIATDDMTEIARIQTCAMPHGSRLNASGTRQYSVCMMDEQLVEIDTGALKVSRHFVLTRGSESGMPGPPMRMTNMNHGAAS